MGGLALAVLATGRSRSAVPALAAAVIALLVFDPGLASDAGFALSVLATAGLLLIAPGWAAALRRRGVPAGCAEALAVPAAAQVACAPVIAAISASVSLAAVPANLLAAPAVAPATMLGVGATLLAPVSSVAAQYAAWLGSWPARWLIWLAHVGARVPAGSLPWPGGAVGGLLLAGVLLVAVVLVRRRVVRRVTLVVMVAAMVGAVPVRMVWPGWPPAGWLLVACDVGQGDSIVLPAGHGAAVVVDTGPTPGSVDTCLRGLGVDRIALLVLTHFHADHVGGVSGVLRGRSIAAIVVPAFSEPAVGSAAVRSLGRAAGIPVTVTAPGTTYVTDGLQLNVLAPVRELRGTHSDPNNNSLIIMASLAGRTVLLTGDAEQEEQATVLAAGPRAGLRADVLKVPHHGSAYQDQAFLAAVAPRVALVSVGRDNDYGQPTRSTLARLGDAGARLLRTDLAGDLAVELFKKDTDILGHLGPGHPLHHTHRASEHGIQ